MEKVKVDFEVCKGCGLCVLACPKHLLQLGKNSNNKPPPLTNC